MILKHGRANLNIVSGLGAWTRIEAKVVDLTELVDQDDYVGALTVDADDVDNMDAGIVVRDAKIEDSKGGTLLKRLAWYGDTSTVPLSVLLKRLGSDKPRAGLTLVKGKSSQGLWIVFYVKSGGTGYNKDLYVGVDNASVLDKLNEHARFIPTTPAKVFPQDVLPRSVQDRLAFTETGEPGF